MPIVRKKLTVLEVPPDPCDECPEKMVRIDSDGVVETSTDGVTWTPDPTADPRNYVPQSPPLPGEDGDDKRCAAANSATALFKQIQQDILAKKELSAGLSDLVSVVIGALLLVGIIATGGIFVVLATAAAVVVANVDAETFGDAFTDTVWEQFACILYCRVSDNGTFTKDNWNLVQDDIDEQIGGLAGNWLNDMLQANGAIGLSNAASLGMVNDPEVDCEGCECGDCNLEAWDWNPYFDSFSPTPITIDTEAGTITQVAVSIGVSDYYSACISSDSEFCDLGVDHYIGDEPSSIAFQGWVVSTEGAYTPAVETSPPWTPAVIGWNCGCLKKCVNIRAHGPFTVVWKIIVE